MKKITRLWHGITEAGRADEYLKHPENNSLRDYKTIEVNNAPYVMVKKFFFYCLIFSLLSPHFVWAQSLITQQAIRDRIAFLASDQMKGRFPGTKESWKCALFIRTNFETAGLRPVGKHYFQYFYPTVKIDTGKKNLLKFDSFNGRLIRDYIPLYFSARKCTLINKVIFCGYGLQFNNDTLALDDYNGSSVTGKWVMILRGLPERFSKNHTLRDSATDYAKAKIAIQNGAAGIIFVNNEELAGKKTEATPNYDDLQRLRPRKTIALEVPVLQIKRAVADLLLQPQNKTIQQLESLNEQPPFELKPTVTSTVDIQAEKVKTANVVGFIEGTDPELRNEYIVLGAHYDHLGMGGYGTGSLQPDTFAIHNGADDNASGSAAIMTIGAQLAKDRQLLKRSIIIVAFGAEEEGLLGSEYFTEHPPVPIEKIKVMINLDMVGHLDEQKELYIGGCGTFAQGVPLLDSLKKDSGLKVYVIPGGVGGSDHVSFYRKNIPVLGMHTGGHPEYHTPQDDLDTLNIPGEEKVCDFVYKAIKEIANITGKIEFIKQGDRD
ncbi:MAG: M28 family peptidase [Ginsengibacter sp.]